MYSPSRDFQETSRKQWAAQTCSGAAGVCGSADKSLGISSQQRSLVFVILVFSSGLLRDVRHELVLKSKTKDGHSGITVLLDCRVSVPGTGPSQQDCGVHTSRIGAYFQEVGREIPNVKLSLLSHAVWSLF